MSRIYSEPFYRLKLAKVFRFSFLFLCSASKCCLKVEPGLVRSRVKTRIEFFQICKYYKSWTDAPASTHYPVKHFPLISITVVWFCLNFSLTWPGMTCDDKLKNYFHFLSFLLFFFFFWFLPIDLPSISLQNTNRVTGENWPSLPTRRDAHAYIKGPLCRISCLFAEMEYGINKYVFVSA